VSRAAYPAALLGALLIVGLTVLAAAGMPNYSHLSQFISELGARGAPHEAWVRFAGFLPAGLLLCAFAWAAHGGLPRSRLLAAGLLGLGIYAAGYVVAAFFPCDPGCRPAQPSMSQVVHNIGGLAGYLLAPLALLALALAARRWPNGGHLVACGFVAAALALLGLLTLSPKSPYVGLSQRVIEASVLSWAVLCGAYVQARGRRQAAKA